MYDTLRPKPSGCHFQTALANVFHELNLRICLHISLKCVPKDQVMIVSGKGLAPHRRRAIT